MSSSELFVGRSGGGVGGEGLLRLSRGLAILRGELGDLEVQQAQFLLAVARAGRPLAMSDAIERLGLSPAGASRTAARFASLGLVVVEEDPDDHRYRLVYLTSKGRALAARLEESCL
jgi:DNA-binding MarR family transcriptional regulator